MNNFCTHKFCLHIGRTREVRKTELRCCLIEESIIERIVGGDSLLLNSWLDRWNGIKWNLWRVDYVLERILLRRGLNEWGAVGEQLVHVDQFIECLFERCYLLGVWLGVVP